MLLNVQGLDTFYGDSQVLRGAALSVKDGEHCAVIGRNGMGKSTLVHTIMGLVKPAKGRIDYKGRDIFGRAPEAVSRLGITIVPQGRRVFASLTVGQNLRISEQIRGEEPWTAEGVCESFPMLGERWDQPAGLLSGGQQQMLALARAIVGNGDLILMDEPSEGLDRHHVSLLVSAIARLHGTGTAVLLVEQKLRFALDNVDSVHIMDRGEIVFTRSAEDVRNDPALALKTLGFDEGP